MTGDERRSLVDLLGRLPILPSERLLFLRSDPETALIRLRLLTAAAIFFDSIAVSDYGGRIGPARERGLVEQVIAAAFQTFGGVDPHPSPFDKAAMLLRGITQGHPFNDGNKRTGFLVAAYFLELVGHPLPDSMPVEEAVHLCFRVSAGELRDVDLIAGDIERLWTVSTTNLPTSK